MGLFRESGVLKSDENTFNWLAREIDKLQKVSRAQNTSPVLEAIVGLRAALLRKPAAFKQGNDVKASQEILIACQNAERIFIAKLNQLGTQVP